MRASGLKIRSKSLVFLLGALAIDASAQTCEHTDLSADYAFRVESKRFKQTASSLDSCVVSVSVKEKQTGRTVQTINYTSTYFFSKVYQNCDAVQSYSTGKNKDIAVVDNDYGDLVVADFNFDGRDDFAVKNDSGGNGGPSYNYYLQNRSGKFILDAFLTHYVSYFPSTIDKKQRILTTLTHAGMDHLRGAAYQFNSDKNEWRRIAHWQQ